MSRRYHILCREKNCFVKFKNPPIQKFNETLLETQQTHAIEPVAVLTLLVANLATRTCISSNFDHQAAPLALPYCLGFSHSNHQLILSWYFHHSESNKLSLNNMD